MLAALMCGTLAMRAWGKDKRDPLRRSFMLLGSITSIYYGSFTLYLLPGFQIFDYIHAAAGAFLPAATMMFFDRLLRGAGSQGPVRSRRIWAVTPLVVAGYAAVHWWFYRDMPRASPAEVVLSILCVMVDALRGFAVIGDHVDMHRARHFPSRQTVQCTDGIRDVSRECVGVDVEEAQPSADPHRDGDGEIEGLDGGLREVDGNQEASEQHAVMLPQKKTPRDPRVEGGGCYPWVGGNAGERRIPPERSRGGLRMRRGLESLPPGPPP